MNENLQRVQENENYICFADPESVSKDGYPLPYILFNKEFKVVEAKVDNLSQAYIFMYQFNDLLVGDKWRTTMGLPPEEVERGLASVHSLNTDDTTH